MDELAAHRLKDTDAGRLSLVERVETVEEFETLKAAGFHYFQGYYFARPQVISGQKLPQNKVAVLQLLALTNDPDTTIDHLADTLSHDVSLSVRTLRYINSPMTGLHCEVTSIFHAAVLLGREHIRNWVTLLVMTGMDDKPLELTKMALSRARFCQLMAQDKGLANDGMYFTIGLLSMLGALMDIELEKGLEDISINEEMRNQLLHGSGDGGEMLRLVAQLEKAEFDSEPENSAIGPVYQDAIAWTEMTVSLL